MADHPTTADIELEIDALGNELRASLAAIVEPIAGSTPRPTQLGRLLGLDKSIASRITRAIRAGTPYESLHFVPSPSGLRMLLDAVATARPERGALGRAERAVRRFESLLASLPGGRVDLESILSDRLEGVRERSARTARQALFRSAAALLGYECEMLVSALVIAPARQDGLLDALEIQHRVGIRFLRPTAAIGLLRVKVLTNGGAAPSVHPRIETLDGSLLDDPARMILTGFSDRDLPELEVCRRGDDVALILKNDGAAPRRTTTLTSGLIFRSGLRSPDGSSTESRSYLLHIPCRRVVRDVFIHQACDVGRPSFSVDLPRPDGAPREREAGLLGEVGSMDVATPVTELGTGIERSGIHGSPRYSGALAEAFERSGWDAARFHGYRVDVAYPVPFVYMICWLPPPA